jgi:phage tail protein X
MMVERICPTCQHGNPLDDRFCGKCGAALERQLPVRRGEAGLVSSGRSLPVTWKQFGRTVAIGVAALAAEAGLAWLRRRIESGPSNTVIPSIRAMPSPKPAPETTAIVGPVANAVTIVSHRVIEIFDGGDGTRRVVERSFWRRTEE